MMWLSKLYGAKIHLIMHQTDQASRQEIDPNDTDLFNRFLPSSTADSITQPTLQIGNEDGQGTNLADLILEKIAAHEATVDQLDIQGSGQVQDAVELPAKVVEVYSK